MQTPVTECEAGSQRPQTDGWLAVAGLGIFVGHLTLDTIRALRSADVVFSLSTNFVTQDMIEGLNKDVRSVHHLYGHDKPRAQTYQEMVDLVMAEVRAGKKVCFAIYGHPGVFADPAHAAMRMAKNEGYDSIMLPAISAEACIYSDLGLDPGKQGSQSHEATDFLIRNRQWDPYSILILWQIAVCGIGTYKRDEELPPGFEMLKQRLIDVYGPSHTCTLYEAPSIPMCDPRREERSLGDLNAEDFLPETTLVILPLPNDTRRNEDFRKLIR